MNSEQLTRSEESETLASPGLPSNTAFGVTEIRVNLDRLSKADPANVQEVAASQILIMDAYHKEALKQAKESFILARRFAFIGLILFFASVSFVFWKEKRDAASIPLISGALAEVIAGVNFYLYGKASEQLSKFHSRLYETQRYLLANSICESLDGEAKQKSRSRLVNLIAGGMEEKMKVD